MTANSVQHCQPERSAPVSPTVLTSANRHSEWSRPIFSSAFISYERVGLRSEESLFDLNQEN